MQYWYLFNFLRYDFSEANDVVIWNWFALDSILTRRFYGTGRLKVASCRTCVIKTAEDQEIYSQNFNMNVLDNVENIIRNIRKIMSLQICARR